MVNTEIMYKSFKKKKRLGGKEHMGVRQMCENYFHHSFQH